MLTVTTVGTVANDYYNLVDECLLAYGIVILTCTSCLFLASLWWFQVRKFNDVLRTFMILFNGLLLTFVGQFYARWLFIYSSMPEYEEFLTSSMWSYRMIPLKIALLYMAALIYARMRMSRMEDAHE